MDFIKVKGLLLGRWSGFGIACYPTIERSEYREEFEVSEFEDLEVLKYEQRTWYFENEKKGKVVFWETGFWVFKEDRIQILSSQYSGRFEELILQVAKQSESGIIQLIFKSQNVVGDSRVVQSTRKYQIAENKMSYQLDMEMSNHRILENHLSASLEKQN